MELQIPVVVPQEVSAIAIATLEARLPGEDVLIDLDNVRKRLSEDCAAVVPQGATISLRALRNVDFSGKRLSCCIQDCIMLFSVVLESTGCHHWIRQPCILPVHSRHKLCIWFPLGFYTRTLTGQLGVHTGDRIVEPGGFC